MEIGKVSTKYLLTIILKLFSFGLLVMAVISSILWITNNAFLHLRLYILLFVSATPLFVLVGYLLISKLRRCTSIADRLSRCRYSRFCCLWWYYDKNPKKEKRIDLDEIRHEIRPCDIILRRYNNYLDGLIFSQNSYFTHAGIFYGNHEGKPNQVIHSTGKDGVGFCNLVEFCQCDDVAILRFTTEVTEEEKIVQGYIEKQEDIKPEHKDVHEKELLVFNDLMDDIKHISSPDKLFIENYRQVILERAKSQLKKPYDFWFLFDDFDALSCIEFVWYCFKCLFPLHRIRVKDFEFFLGILKVPVIVPDVFIKNDYFKYIYASIPKVRKQEVNKRKNALRKHVQENRTKILSFAFSFLIWEAIILAVCFLSKKYDWHSWIQF